MPLITWSDEYSVNVKEIDEQHKKLIGMINDLYDGMQEGRGRDIIGDILSKMIDYAKFHFQTEEKYFDTFKYEFTDEHKNQHQGFVLKTAEFFEKFESGAAGLSLEVMNFLRDWLLNHIKGADKKYTACLNEHGIK